MTGSRIFVDTAPIIYLVEENPKYLEKVSLYLADSIQNHCILTTSVLTLAEVEIKPRRLGKIEVLNKFNTIMRSLFDVSPITWDVAKISATLRSKYSSLRAIDSLQVACAINSQCEVFVTNDRRLRIIKEIPILLTSNL